MANLFLERSPELRRQEIMFGSVAHIIAILFAALAWVLATVPDRPTIAWKSVMVLSVFIAGVATFLVAKDKRRWWFLLPVVMALALESVIIGWLLIWAGQHRLIAGPVLWGDYADGNIVVLGNWMLLIGSSVLIPYCSVKLFASRKTVPWVLYMVTGGTLLFLANQAFGRFQLWGTFQTDYWFAILGFTPILAGICRVLYVRHY